MYSALSSSFASKEALAEHFRSRSSPRFIINPEKKDTQVFKARELFPGNVDSAIDDADLITGHVFDLLGSGPTKLGDKIDWHRDFKSGYRWPMVYYKEIYYKDYDKRYDVKVPRELSRFQHFTTLGKAYWYTGDEKYAAEFVTQVNDWIDKNPPEVGVNWQCTMDVAIRIVNWIWGFYFFKNSKSVSDNFITGFLKNCLIHGRHIRNNLEWNEHVNSNHYISDLVGLVWLGLMFPEFKESGEWLHFGTKEMLNELESQVYEDGMDYEASTSYHRLVLELYYTTAMLARLNDINWPGHAWDKIHNMFRFVKGIIKPSGEIPQIGDNDSGRLHILEKRDDLSQTYLLDIAAVLFDDPSFKLRNMGFSEEALWLLGPKGHEAFKLMHKCEDIEELPSIHFKNSGICVIRERGNYCAISCGPNGQNGNGGHAHNDKLSFDLNISGRDIIVDPGTYVYTGNFRLRNLFRSTKYHNTVSVDDVEMNEFDIGRLFQLPDNSNAKVHLFKETESRYEFMGKHSGYCSTRQPVLHTRHIAFNRGGEYWVIHDSLTGPGGHRHLFEQHFHFAPHCCLEKSYEHGTSEHKSYLKDTLAKACPEDIELRTFSVRSGGLFLFISFASNYNTDIALEKGWVSRSYGAKEQAPTIAISCSGPCPAYFYTVISRNK
jgi:hypothetical protein